MNLRALTRGDAAVAGAAVLLLIASFLPYYSIDAGAVSLSSSAWSTSLFPVLPSVFLLGLIAAALILLQRFQGEAVANRQVLGLRLDQWGIALSAAALWTSLWSLLGGSDSPAYGHSFGAYLALLSLLVLAGAAAAGPLVPALQAPLLTDKPATPAAAQGYPYAGVPGGQPGQPGQPDQYGQYGYPGPAGHDPAAQAAQAAQGGHPLAQTVPQPNPHDQAHAQAQQAPYGAQQQPAAGYGYPAPTAVQPQVQDHTPAPVPSPTPAPAPAAAAAPFAPFWFAVPAVRQLASKDNPVGGPVGELVPGTWYLAVDQRGAALVAQLPDGTHGVLNDTTGIQRG